MTGVQDALGGVGARRQLRQAPVAAQPPHWLVSAAMTLAAAEFMQASGELDRRHCLRRPALSAHHPDAPPGSEVAPPSSLAQLQCRSERSSEVP